jgi:hypothetical protein
MRSPDLQYHLDVDSGGHAFPEASSGGKSVAATLKRRLHMGQAKLGPARLRVFLNRAEQCGHVTMITTPALFQVLSLNGQRTLVRPLSSGSDDGHLNRESVRRIVLSCDSDFWIYPPLKGQVYPYV